MDCEQCQGARCSQDVNCEGVEIAAALFRAAVQAGNRLTLEDVLQASGLSINAWTRWAKETMGEALGGEIGYEQVGREGRFLVVLPKV